MLEGGKLRPGQGLSRVQTKAWGDGHAVLSDVNNRGASYPASVLQLMCVRVCTKGKTQAMQASGQLRLEQY